MLMEERTNARWSLTSYLTSSPTDGASVSYRRSTRQTGFDRLGPRHRVHLQCDAGLMQGQSHRLALHRRLQANPRTPLSRASTAGCATSSLNETLLFGLDDTRRKLAAWVTDYNGERPQSSLKYQTPAAFAGNLHRNGRSAAQPRPARRSSVCSTRANRRTNPCLAAGTALAHGEPFFPIEPVDTVDAGAFAFSPQQHE